jgi:hypothetical protein
MEKKNSINRLIHAFESLMLAIVFLCVGCTSDNDFSKGKRQLEQQGYVDVKKTGWNALCCDENDTFSTGFECKDKNGNVLKGCFCSTVIKGVTIRFD